MAVVRPSVLIVHDQALGRRSLARFLHPVAIVCDVDSAEAALEALATGTVFDAVVVDVSAEPTWGMQLYAKLVRRYPALAERIIAIGGSEADLWDEAFRNCIGDRVLPTPVEREELQQLVLAVAGSADVAAE